MGETNVTPKRMHQGGITLLVLPANIPLLRTPLIETHYTTDKKQTVKRRELPRMALIQIETDIPERAAMLFARPGT
jgi:hypothetical protein